jgi:PST family polysaccharide transporter
MATMIRRYLTPGSAEAGAALRVARNAAWLMGDRVVRAGVGVLLVVWIARYLGAERFGIYNYVLAFVSIFSGVATLGLDAIAIRDLIDRPEQRGRILGTVFWLKLAGGVAAYVALVVAIAIVSPDMLGLAAVAGSALLFQSADVVECWFQSGNRMKYAVLARNAAFFVLAGVKVGLLLGGASVMVLLAAGVAEVALAAAILLVMYQRDARGLGGWRFDRTLVAQLLRDAAPMLVSALAILLYMRIDQVMIASLAGYREVGVFSAAVRLTEVWYFIPVALMAALFPLMVSARRDAGIDDRARTALLFGAMGWAGIVLAAATSLGSSWLVALFYGDAYAGAAPVLALQAWMAAFVFFGVARGRWLVANNRHRDGMFVDVAGVLINVGANLLLIPRYGAYGAAMASLITGFGANLLVGLFSDAIRTSLGMYVRGLLLPFTLLRARAA